MKDLIINTRKYREMLLSDPYRPGYHFCGPDDDGRPGDSNGAFYADGRYHLMYLYRNSETEAFNWGHVSSTDLLHWRHHKDAIGSHNGDGGCFSGGAFLDDDKRAYLTFWKFNSIDGSDNSGIAMAYADPPYEDWCRMEPIAVNASHWGVKDIEINGETLHLGNADPSNIWKTDGTYYMQLGNLCVLNEFGRNEDSEEKYKGDWTELYRSKDLKNWEYVHRFYKNPHLDEDYPDATEDDMCPSFLPLYDKKSGGKFTGKYLQLFIAHNKGCQYYIGELKNEEFFPEKHGRMSWKDNTYFAPEALIDDKNRHIIWTWLQDNQRDDFVRYGWSGVFGLPRCVWLEDNELKIAPADEMSLLEYNKVNFSGVYKDLAEVPVKNGRSFRLKAEINIKGKEKCGFRVLSDSEMNEYTDIYFLKSQNKLIMDTSNSGSEGWKIKEEAPFILDGDKLYLDIFVDKCVIEVFANEKQAITRRAYPTDVTKNTKVYFIGDESEVIFEVSEMMESNPY